MIRFWSGRKPGENFDMIVRIRVLEFLHGFGIPPGRAHLGDGLVLPDPVPNTHQKASRVRVELPGASGMGNDDCAPISTEPGCITVQGENDAAWANGTNQSTCGGDQVNALVYVLRGPSPAEKQRGIGRPSADGHSHVGRLSPYAFTTNGG